MKIGIMSDSHGNVSAFREAMEILKDVQIILHSGDILAPGPKNPILDGYNPPNLSDEINKSEIPFIFAKGNCDSDVDDMLINFPVQSPYAFVVIDGIRILVEHGHRHNDEGRIEIAKRMKIDIVISGHTHIPKLERAGNILLVNPGSISIPLGGVKDRTVGILDTITKEVKILTLSGKIFQEFR